MKRVIYLICFLVVIFHAWNPGSLISSQEIPKEFVGIKAEFEQILETHTILPPPFDPEVPIDSVDYEYFYFEDINGAVKRSHFLTNIEYISLDINQDSQQDLIIRADIESIYRYSYDSVLVVFINDVSQNTNLKFKGIKSLCKRHYVGCPNQGIIKKGRTLVLHDHIYRISLTDRDFFHRPQRISIKNLMKDSFYDTIFFDENE